jgi:hypothetical protein
MKKLINTRSFIFAFIVAIGLMIEAPAFAQEEVKVKVSTGFDYSTGDYGQPVDTEILYFPVITQATYGNWIAKLTVPYLRIKGPGTVIGGGGGVVVCEDISGKEDLCSIVPTNAVTTESGLGDIIGALTYTIDVAKYDLFLDFTGKIKFPTADEGKRLGTGETDYTIQMDATKMFGSSYVFGGVGRRFVGDNEQFQLNDIWLFNAGAGYQVNKKLGIGASYDFRESASTAEDASEATGYLTYKVTDSITTMLYGVAGFSDGSPDASVGLQVSYKFEPF